MVTDDGGAVGLTESPSTLQRLMVSSPEMACHTTDFEASVDQGLQTLEVCHREWFKEHSYKMSRH